MFSLHGQQHRGMKADKLRLFSISLRARVVTFGHFEIRPLVLLSFSRNRCLQCCGSESRSGSALPQHLIHVWLTCVAAAASSTHMDLRRSPWCGSRMEISVTFGAHWISTYHTLQYILTLASYSPLLVRKEVKHPLILTVCLVN